MKEVLQYPFRELGDKHLFVRFIDEAGGFSLDLYFKIGPESAHEMVWQGEELVCGRIVGIDPLEVVIPVHPCE